ncbi:hypothetical protein [Trinickia sp.]|uniref:hypothetical protein n=1 Tax=Trinickia sp. TaxID=2571163 RepID=UPI003F7CE6A9
MLFTVPIVPLLKMPLPAPVIVPVVVLVSVPIVPLLVMPAAMVPEIPAVLMSPLLVNVLIDPVLLIPALPPTKLPALLLVNTLMVPALTIPYVMPAMVPLLVSVPSEEPVDSKAVAVLKLERTTLGAIVQLPEDQPISVVFALMVPLIPQSAFAISGATPVSAPATAAAIARCLGGTLMRFIDTSIVREAFM